MDAQELKDLQAPLKAAYRDEPGRALITLRAEGRLGENVSCSVATGRALVEAGLHPATGGSGLQPVRATCCSRRWWPAPA